MYVNSSRTTHAEEYMHKSAKPELEYNPCSQGQKQKSYPLSIQYWLQCATNVKMLICLTSFGCKHDNTNNIGVSALAEPQPPSWGKPAMNLMETTGNQE